MSNLVLEEFIGRAKEVSVADAALVLGIPRPKGEQGMPFSSDRGQPCPVCHGKDRFSINARKSAWNCRNCQRGGASGISLAAHVLHYDLKGYGFLQACAAVLGLTDEDIPQSDLQESEEERIARKRRIDESRDKAERERADNERRQNEYRDREISKARGIYLNASKAIYAGGDRLQTYLLNRTGFGMAIDVFECLRFALNLSYWHGQDEMGRPTSTYSGYAMVAPFVDLSGKIVGCHLTWIDLSRSPKFRPDLGLDDKGDPLPTKKMRGIKKGGLIPLCGDMGAKRWVGGEGIENTLSIAGYEGFDRGTFYFAAGDLGNLAGPADRSAGRSQPVVGTDGKKFRVHPHPRPEQGEDEACQVPAHVTQIVLIADGDSEFYFTAAAMARAKARLSAPGRDIKIWWPPRGADFASVLSKRA